MSALTRQAHSAVRHGFAGVSLPEHHNARRGYVTNPLLTAAALLPGLGRGWVAAAPTILGLRPPRIVLEDTLALESMFPGRIGLAVGAGFDKEDFDLVGVPFDGRLARFREALRELRDGRVEHPAIDGCEITAVPVLVATRGVRNVAVAARHGFGLLLPPLTPATARRFVDLYREAGGRGRVAIGRWAWLGAAPTAAIAALNAEIAGTSGDLSWRDADSVLTVEAAAAPEDLAARLGDYLAATGADHLHLRIHLPGLSPAEVDRQIEAIGRDVLPMLHFRLRSPVR